METQKFIENLAHIIRTSKGLDELRRLILMLSLQGKLVKQNSNDEKASEILKRIQKEKVNQHNLRALHQLDPISEDETPFMLPSSWDWTRLGDITNYGISERSKDTKISEGTWVLDLEDIEKTTSRILKKVRFKERPFQSDKVIFQKGDVIYGKLRPYLNKVIVADEDGVCSSELVPIKPYDRINPYYLLLALKSPEFLAYVSQKTYGVKMPRLGTKDARNALIPLPPLAEQQRIVAKVDGLLSLCDQLEKLQQDGTELREKANLALVDILTSSNTSNELVDVWNKYTAKFTELLVNAKDVDIIIEALKTLAILGKLGEFSNNTNSQEIVDQSLLRKNELLASKDITKQKVLPPLSRSETNRIYPSNWSVALFDDLASVSGGITKGRSFKGRKTSSHPYLRVANVQRGYFSLDDVQEIEIPEDEFEKYVLADGDILITEGGDWDKVGRTAIWRNEVLDCLHQNHVFKARLFSEKIMKEWVELVFNSSVGRRYWENASKQTTNLASINMTQVRSFPFPVPSQDEQQCILDQLGKLLTICDDLKEYLIKFREIHEGFSKAAIYSILYDKPRSKIMSTEQNILPKSFKRQISVEIALAPTISNDLANTKLAILLQENGGKLEAKELWKASKLKEIDEFYALLKQEIDAGFIQQPSTAEIKLTEEVE